MALTINLPKHIKHIQDYIEQQVSEGRFENEEAVIVDVFEQVIGEYRWEDDPELLAAIAEADRGEGVPWTPELMDQIVEEAMENSRRGYQVPDDIKY
jgi:Arc/MetJ-type ribon-helix-helix transcriptional regulator